MSNPQTADVTLYAYPPSSYCQSVGMMLAECGIVPRVVTVDPFGGSGSIPHPFGAVPVLEDGSFALYETAAILRYLDAAYAGGRFTPAAPHALARMAQVEGIADSQGYRAFVRQVYGERIFAPLEGERPDEAVIAEGMVAARAVLAALEAIAAEGLVLTGSALTLADVHLAPMMGFFAATPEGAAALASHPALSAWFGAIAGRRSYRETSPLGR
ncbi:glutathione S-transferase family protein [Pseudodonghicola flavimaris]|uniref:glutathione transferase n=1 Tax=Pseudodonghicola flavimaris TaxID=3050036 RepID=A0ABT7EZA0_9RHOB|nr:glutathione S-transferase family protein [Pseudodonghicola flavimaris]MDK3017678.1 glutathione S-transferase family protein [Pseudodonghicola flavimaris]